MVWIPFKEKCPEKICPEAKLECPEAICPEVECPETICPEGNPEEFVPVKCPPCESLIPEKTEEELIQQNCDANDNEPKHGFVEETETIDFKE